MPGFQKVTLLTHISSSVGWFGAVVPYLALVVAGLTTNDAQLARAACLSMNLIGWYVIVPLSFVALLSGLAMSLITQWGLFRHWWILAKCALTIFAAAVLLQHMQDVSRLAKETKLSNDSFQPDFIHATGGLVVLLAAMTLSVFKPWGATPYGRRRLSQARVPLQSSGETVIAPRPILAPEKSQWSRIVRIHAAHLGVIVLLFVAILHITGMHHHH